MLDRSPYHGPSRTTGEPLGAPRTPDDAADREWIAGVRRRSQETTPDHRSIVLWDHGLAEPWFTVNCRTCKVIDGGTDKAALDEVARAHEREYEGNK